jgi:hypothetical protein
VVDEQSRKLINSAVKEEEILNLNVSSELCSGPRTLDSLLTSTVTPQILNRLSSDGCPIQIWTLCTFSRRSHGLLTV